MNKTGIWILCGVLGGAAAVGGVAVAVWNSKQMRAARAVKHTSRILYAVGSALQSISMLK